MLKPLLFATLAAFGNALYVYGQRGVTPPANPFLFVWGAIATCLILLSIAALFYRSNTEIAYISNNLGMIAISGLGFFLTFVGFFLLYTSYGASQYTLYAVISILTTSLGVGVLIYREDFNIYKIAAMLLAMAAIALFTYGNSKSL
jgi:drug/metabolite transporter (DMT)-like permease